MEPLNGKDAMEIVQATPPAADIYPVSNIEPKKDSLPGAFSST